MALPTLVPLEDEGLDSQIEEIRKTIEWEKKVRISLFIFTALLVIGAPVISYLYPSTWTLILASALAFTIGTNLLISVVTVRVENKADSMEERMVELLESLHIAAHRLEVFHTQLDGINIPAIRDLLENVRDEVAPGLHSLDDIDIVAISHEIRRASAFFDTLDMDKLGGYLRHIRKEEDQDKPFLMPVVELDPDYEEFWGDDEDDIDEGRSLIANLFNSDNDASSSQQDDAFLTRLIG